MTKFSFRTLAALVAASAMSVAAPLALAQEPPQPQQPQAQQPGLDQPQAGAADLAEEDLQRFAMAAIQVQQINQTYAPQFQEAQSPQEQQQIRQQANQAAAQAVQEAGLSIEEFNDISRLATQNEDVAERVTNYIQEALPEQPQAPEQPQQ